MIGEDRVVLPRVEGSEKVKTEYLISLARRLSPREGDIARGISDAVPSYCDRGIST